MKKLKTWAGRSQFQYSGSVKTGTEIIYGEEYTQKISAEQYKLILTAFSGKTVDIGTSRDNPPNGSLGKWLQNNITKVAIASYVGPVLIEEGYARKVSKHEIEILK